MERTEIIKALECCSKDDCDNCPNGFGNCYSNLAKDALALINEQEQKIKELTEENERLRASCTELARVQEENERLIEAGLSAVDYAVDKIRGGE